MRTLAPQAFRRHGHVEKLRMEVDNAAGIYLAQGFGPGDLSPAAYVCVRTAKIRGVVQKN